MPDVRAKFNISSIELYSEPRDSGRIKLQAVYGNGTENASWSRATPSGQLEMYISNPTAFEVFKEAYHNKKAIYLDFTVET